MAIKEYYNPAVTGVGVVEEPLYASMIIAVFVGVSWYNALELTIIMFTIFRRYNGLYFWTLLVSTWGMVVFSLAFLMKFYRIWTNNYISVTFITIGWYAMVTGQALVLWSRLHLIVRDERKIRWVLIMIITNVFLFHVPTTVLTFGSNSSEYRRFAYPYMVMERIQLTAFSIQEILISGLYVWETYRLLRPSECIRKKKARRVMQQLIAVNVFIILLDITMLFLQFSGYYPIQIAYKSFVYGVKLKLEFFILNKLMELARPRRQTNASCGRYNGFTATKEIPLYQMDLNMDSTPNRPKPMDEESSQIGYEFHASTARPPTRSVKENCVMATTEVKVESSKRPVASSVDGSRREMFNDGEVGLRTQMSGRSGKGSSRHSPSTSETELAAAGY